MFWLWVSATVMKPLIVYNWILPKEALADAETEEKWP
jgi:hypothetical protein